MKHIIKEAYHIILTLGMATYSVTIATLVTNMDRKQWNVILLKRKLKKVPLKRQSAGDASMLGIQQSFFTP